jgi:hypothetical protein
MDVKNELSSNEDDFDGVLDMTGLNHTGTFPHRKEGICVVYSAYISPKGSFGKYRDITPSSRKKSLLPRAT